MTIISPGVTMVEGNYKAYLTIATDNYEFIWRITQEEEAPRHTVLLEEDIVLQPVTYIMKDTLGAKYFMGRINSFMGKAILIIPAGVLDRQ